MRFTKRRSLLIALVVGEITCLLFGGIWFSRWLNASLQDLIGRQVLRDNVLVASQFAKLIEQMELKDLSSGSDDWLRLQQAVEDMRLPNDGFVCITGNPSGALICHPELRQKPNMAHMTPGKSRLDNGSTSRPIVQLMAADGEASGRATMRDGVHLLAARRIPKLNVNVMVHQRQSGIQASISRVLKPVYAIGLIVSFAVVTITVMVNLSIIRRYENRLAIVNDQLETTVKQRTRALIKTRNATIFGLAKLAESRDTDTGDHLERIRDYAVILSETLARNNPMIDRVFIDDLFLASSLHDIGKVGIPDAVLLKPERFTAEERTIIERHATIGGDCLAEIECRLGDDDFLEMARKIAYSHHERWDGTGYPQGLKADEIPLAARIVAVADVYDALTSKRPYKEAMEHEVAYDLIIGGSGSQFDPEVVAAFVSQEQEFSARALDAQQSAAAGITGSTIDSALTSLV